MITSYFIKKKVQILAAAERQRSHRSLPFEQVKSILILYNAADHEALQEGIERLKATHKQVQTCLFVASEALAEEEKKSVIVVEQKALSTWGFPSEEVVSQGRLADRPYPTRLLPDAVYGLTPSIHLQGRAEIPRTGVV